MHTHTRCPLCLTVRLICAISATAFAFWPGCAGFFLDSRDATARPYTVQLRTSLEPIGRDSGFVRNTGHLTTPGPANMQ